MAGKQTAAGAEEGGGQEPAASLIYLSSSSSVIYKGRKERRTAAGWRQIRTVFFHFSSYHRASPSVSARLFIRGDRGIVMCDLVSMVSISTSHYFDYAAEGSVFLGSERRTLSKQRSIVTTRC